jgi:hypothetical protein
MVLKMPFGLCLCVSKVLIINLAIGPILFENFLSAEIRQVSNFRGLKSDRLPKLIIEIGGLNQLLVTKKKKEEFLQGSLTEGEGSVQLTSLYQLV